MERQPDIKLTLFYDKPSFQSGPLPQYHFTYIIIISHLHPGFPWMSLEGFSSFLIWLNYFGIYRKTNSKLYFFGLSFIETARQSKRKELYFISNVDNVFCHNFCIFLANQLHQFGPPSPCPASLCLFPSLSFQ